VSLGATDIVLKESAIEGDRLRKVFNPAIRPGVEAATPGFVSHSYIS
jgi:hypothetical protein